MRKIVVVCLLLMVFVLVVSFLPSVVGTESIVAEYQGSFPAVGSMAVACVYAVGYSPGAGGGVAETFQGDGSYLTEFVVYLNKTGTPTGSLMALLFVGEPINNSYGVAQSQTVSISDQVSGVIEADHAVSFYFDGGYELVDDTTYSIALVSVAGSVLSGSNYIQYATNSTSGGGFAGAHYTANLAPHDWRHDNEGSYDLYFVLYGSDVDLTATPTPTPSPTPTPTASPEPTATPEYPTEDDTTLWSNIFEYIMLFLVLLAPALLLWWKAGKWGFVTGLIVGAVISYMFFGLASNMWGLLLVGSVIVIAVVGAATKGGN